MLIPNNVELRLIVLKSVPEESMIYVCMNWRIADIEGTGSRPCRLAFPTPGPHECKGSRASRHGVVFLLPNEKYPFILGIGQALIVWRPTLQKQQENTSNRMFTYAMHISQVLGCNACLRYPAKRRWELGAALFPGRTNGRNFHHT